MPLDTIIDPFHREFYTRVAEELETRKNNLSKGSAALTQYEHPNVTVAERYAAGVSYIQALNDVLSIAAEIEQRRYSNVRSQNDEDDGGFA